MISFLALLLNIIIGYVIGLDIAKRTHQHATQIASRDLLQEADMDLKEKKRFVPTQGRGGVMAVPLVGETCKGSGYIPSQLEKTFADNALAWLQSSDDLCSHLSNATRQTWIDTIQGRLAPSTGSTEIFSRWCEDGQTPQAIEPLAGLLRDPRFLCDENTREKKFSIEWLLLADKNRLAEEEGARKILFDAGGTHFMDAMNFFTSEYERRGIVFDEVHVWEAQPQGTEAYWQGTPPEVRMKWEPRLFFYDGVPVTATPGDDNNPVYRIHTRCRPNDFCAFKLDIDTPSVELPIVEQLLASPALTGATLDEFFFEHHVHGLMQYYGWGTQVNGTFADSYAMFTKLRQLGVRCHSWI